jgi:hypothetical protein
MGCTNAADFPELSTLTRTSLHGPMLLTLPLSPGPGIRAKGFSKPRNCQVVRNIIAGHLPQRL